MIMRHEPRGFGLICCIAMLLFFCGSSFALESGGKEMQFSAGNIYHSPELSGIDDWAGVYEQKSGTVRMKLAIQRNGRFTYSYDADRAGSEKNAEMHSFILLTLDKISIIDMRGYEIFTYQRVKVKEKTILLSEAELTRLNLVSGDEERGRLMSSYLENGRVKVSGQ